MLVLALDTSTPAVTAGVVELGPDGAETRAERVTVDARAHGELLTPHLLEAVGAAGIALNDLAAVVCGSGPGPFTGLRAGLATAASLGQVLDVPVYPVCGLDAIAAEASVQAKLLVVTDARRREVYWAVYDADGTRLHGPAVDRPDEIDLTGVEYVAGHGVQVYPDAFELTAVEPWYPSPRGLVLAAADELRSGADPAPLTARYLRRPDAQEPGRPKRVLV
ncbi:MULTISPECIES: tRNA (adenosine(37)-N6)-threonylcarbamoyltransferase complex dimerization subunit type 1 TsaB [Thermocrispum]|jgi:tRNA threonylcarbamoyl adenosine modification protein YeaZ|uniref:tRNA (Adenosine(37)-N6)-threonylcarbamoyltransferase complex dimerization subunit type 1 TsaB n=1 Tax=Thermocrispum agreste TaxID=37925 RepID=A0ABD6FES5_9PSEU|nr:MULTISPECIES: tRNA (adenosine(37)-N6)-threonylcarbamoyltransferase complex dimerization subunit type 1 TsaB [Thermocrispum]